MSSINSRIQKTILRAVPTNPSLPILKAARIGQAYEDCYGSLITYDLEYAVLHGTYSDLTTLVDARAAIDNMGKRFDVHMPGSFDQDNAPDSVVSFGDATVPLRDIEQAPNLPEFQSRVDHRTLDAKDAGDALPWLLSAMSSDKTRAALCNLSVRTDGNLESTDGHRLHRYSTNVNTSWHTLIPRAVVALVCKLPLKSGGIVRIYKQAVEVVIAGAMPVTIWWGELASDNYPNTDQIWPETHASARITVDASALSNAMKHCAALVKKSVKVCTISNGTPGIFDISATDRNGGNVKTSVEYAGNLLAPFGVNPQYMVDLLKGSSRLVSAYIETNPSQSSGKPEVNSALVWDLDSGRRALVMPTRVNDK